MALPRIAMVGLASENCTFSRARTTRDDFTVLKRAALQRARYPFLDTAAFGQACFLPLMHGRALPGGRIARETYDSLKAELLGELEQALPVNGIYFDLHGAMHVEGMDDAEADLVEAARSLVGESCYIGASFDLHGNLSARLVDCVDIFSAYRTAPHVDTEATREKVCRLLQGAVCQGWALERSWIPVPVLLPGEQTSTLDEPGSSLYAGLSAFDALPGILDVSLWVGYVWADESRAHASVVVTGMREAGSSTAEVAETVARRYWEAREAFRFNVPAGSLTECLTWAISDTVRPVLISDSGDNPTAGGVGNLPHALRVLVQREIFATGRKRAVVAGIWDPDAVAACSAAGRDAEIELTIGKEADRRHSPATTVRGKVVRTCDHDPVAGRQIVFQIGEGIEVVLTTRRKPFHHFSDFHALGLAPEEADIVVVKIGYLVTDLRKMAAKAYLALTPGAVDQNVTRVRYTALERPIYPFDQDFSWSAKARQFYSRARKS